MGKSTFIEGFGLQLVEMGFKVLFYSFISLSFSFLPSLPLILSFFSFFFLSFLPLLSFFPLLSLPSFLSLNPIFSRLQSLLSTLLLLDLGAQFLVIRFSFEFLFPPPSFCFFYINKTILLYNNQ